MPCLRCGNPVVTRPRGLCWVCYYTPGVKALYPVVSKYGRRGVADTYGGHALPEPTDEWPGSAEKLAVLEARAAAGLALFHPADPRLEPRRGPPAGIRLGVGFPDRRSGAGRRVAYLDVEERADEFTP